ncbi:telomerase RNA component interacting RNase [Carcharodon carcharias]|uniref:telomerase RNA component interacting RNase n=1 Tax=Carcharodon carcharias TaxID=13397 RepID=UPI001B7DF4C6|nr:telomerase RNA component interacting RNase [Carcharodon carcharias]
MADRRRSREVSGSSEAGDADGGGGSESKGVNAFANDGSFMALFKKKMEEQKLRSEGGAAPSGGDIDNGGKRSVAAGQEQSNEAQSDRKKSVLNIVGKRRGGAKLALKTGMVAKKHKAEEEAEARGGDAWAKYMAEVKKYKAHQCSDDDKTRPLVK